MEMKSMRALKFLHHIDQDLHRSFGKCVVHGSAVSTNATVAFEAIDSSAFPEAIKRGCVRLVFEPEGGVHGGSTIDGCVAFEQAIAVNLLVDEVRFSLIPKLHRLHASHGLHPTHGEHGDIDWKDRWGVEHAVFGRMNGQIQVGGDGPTCFSDGIPIKCVHDRSRRPHVLLSARVDELICLRVERSRKDVGAHVRNERNAASRRCSKLCTENGVVGRVMQIGRSGGHGIQGGDSIVIRGFGRANDVSRTRVFGFFDGHVGPRARIDVRCSATFRKEIVCSGEKAQAGSSLQKQHVKAFG
jgi:hypothetical protein